MISSVRCTAAQSGAGCGGAAGTGAPALRVPDGWNPDDWKPDLHFARAWAEVTTGFGQVGGKVAAIGHLSA